MSSLRIVSLLPSASEILHELGFGSSQVGRSHECDFPAIMTNLPVCTRPTFDVSGSSVEINRLVKARLSSTVSIYRIESNLLMQLRPTHVLTQTLCDVCAVSFADVQAAFNGENGLSAEIIPLSAGSLQGLWMDVQRVASSLGNAPAGEKLVRSLSARMAALQELAMRATVRPRVAAIEWIDPLMAAGNWVPELIEQAGGNNLFGKTGEHSPWMKWEELRNADPDVIVALPCGFDLARTRSELRVLTAKSGWSDLKAVRSGEVYVCDGNQFMNRPGPRLVESLQIFCEIFHPSIFEPVLEGKGWECY